VRARDVIREALGVALLAVLGHVLTVLLFCM